MSAHPAEVVELDDLRALAIRVAEQAAELQRRELHGVRRAIEQKSSATDVVTDVDRACEQLLLEGILASRPDDAVLGEEGTDRPGTSGVRWVIDPLDGTTNFLYGHPGFGVSVAAEIDGRSAVGVVIDTMAGDVYAATLGGGATRDGAAVRSSTIDELAAALVGTGFSYDPRRRRQQAEVLVELLPAVRDVRRMGAAAVDLCSVACGRLDAYFERGLAPWDHAAGGLIAAEAGAIVTGIADDEPSADGIVAAGPALSDALRALLRRAGANLPPPTA